MIDIAILRAMAAAGATVDMILAAIEADQSAQEKRTTERRAKDAERQRRNRLSRVVTRTDADSRGPSDDVCDTSAHIDSTLTSNIKKVSKKAIAIIEIADRPSESDIAYAKTKNWFDTKIASEWERFRNNNIAKGKKYRSQRAIHAAWCNWVTSPFQAPVPELAKPSLVEQTGFYAAFSSPEMISWSNHERMIGKSYPRDKAGGWRFPSQWPPGLDPPRVENREGVMA